MLFNSIKNYYYTADYYSYKEVTSADGSVTERVYVEAPESFRLAVTTSFIGDLVILTDSKLQIDGYVSNLLDKNGQEVFIEGLWKITQTQPVLNALGFAEGFKYKAKILSGNK
jgi:hypothetical protein